MTISKNNNNYWSFEMCKEEALKYNSRSKFKKESNACYIATRRNGWLIECCQHMGYLNKPSGYWTLERCKEEALKYKMRTEFQKLSNGI